MSARVVQSGMEIGGGVRLSPEDHILKFPTCGNTPDDVVRRNVLHASSLGLPFVEPGLPNGGHAMICGGGPSLVDHLALIRGRQRMGWEVVTINGTAAYLARNGIKPDVLLLLDARQHNVRFLEGVPPSTTLYLASQCDPEVFRVAQKRGFDIRLWHASIMPSEYADHPEVWGGKDDVVVFHGAGTTAGLLACNVLAYEGFKHLHLFGFDSSYRMGEGHPYPQPENADELPMEIAIGGHNYLAPIWMQTQAARFPWVAQQVWEQFKTTLHVYGDGLLPAVAAGLSFNPRDEIGDALLICGDAREELPNVKADCIVTDLPFVRGITSELVEYASDPGTVAVINCDTRMVGEVIQRMREGRWEYLRHLVMPCAPAKLVHGWTRTHDISLVFARGTPEFYAPGPDLYGFASDPIQGHPTQKPVATLAHIIANICPPGGTVLDPFMGSGSTGVAALSIGRKFIGIEREPQYFEIARKRLADARKDLDGRSTTPSEYSGAA